MPPKPKEERLNLLEGNIVTPASEFRERSIPNGFPPLCSMAGLFSSDRSCDSTLLSSGRNMMGKGVRSREGEICVSSLVVTRGGF